LARNLKTMLQYIRRDRAGKNEEALAKCQANAQMSQKPAAANFGGTGARPRTGLRRLAAITLGTAPTHPCMPSLIFATAAKAPCVESDA
jgi:hypothetical protein